MTPINLSLLTHPASSNRGIGYYSQHLMNTLTSMDQVNLNSSQPDLVHYTFFDFFYPTLKINPQIPTIVTIHDVTPLVLSHLYPKGIKGTINLFRQRYTLKKANAVITDSNNSKTDIHTLLGVPQQKIFAIPLAADPLYLTPTPLKILPRIKRKYRLPNKFALYIGGLNPNKNLVRLAEACLSLNLPLVLVGSDFSPHHFRNSPTSIKKRLGLQSTHPEHKDAITITNLIHSSNQIYPLGYVSTEDLAIIFRLATFYCQPSLYEGFGLPLLEAMTARCLIVSANTSSLPELYPQGTITFDPHNLSSIKTALFSALQLSPQQRENLIQKAFNKSKSYSWQKTAELTLGVYQRIYNEFHNR